MITEFIDNKDNGIFNFIQNKLNFNDKKVNIILSQIDDQAFEKIDNILPTTISNLFICVDKHLTTKILFKYILQSNKYTNKYVYNNSDLQNIKLNNLFILIDENDIEILLLPFCINEFIISKSDSFAIYLKGNIEQDIVLQNIYNKYIHNIEYMNLTEEFIKKCEENKSFRNNKANNLYKDINKDEMIHSFRTLMTTENPDETLKVIQTQREAKKFSLDKSELSFNIENNNSILSNQNLNNDIDIEIDLNI